MFYHTIRMLKSPQRHFLNQHHAGPSKRRCHTFDATRPCSSSPWPFSPAPALRMWTINRSWYPLVNVYIATKNPPFSMGNSTISMAMFNSYVKLPGGYFKWSQDIPRNSALVLPAPSLSAGGFFIDMCCLGSNLCYQKSCLFDHLRAPSSSPHLRAKKRTCPSTRWNVRVVNIGIPMKHGKLNVNHGIITYYNGILPINWCSISQPSTL